MPKSQRTDSFLYLRSPLELIRMAGSLPLLPQRLIVRVETRSRSATSLTVKRSGRLLMSRSLFDDGVLGRVFVSSIYKYF
jgi:hypothetical protein